jgi:hypothetical protein
MRTKSNVSNTVGTKGQTQRDQSLVYLHCMFCCLLISRSMLVALCYNRVYGDTRFLCRGGRSHDTRLENSQGGIEYV